MPPKQIERYQATLQLIQEGELTGTQRGNRILQVLYQLRDICDHPLLPDTRYDCLPASELIPQSAKLQATVEILEQVRQANEKIILFTDRRKTQHLLQHVIREQFDFTAISIINGDTPGSVQAENTMKRSRQQIIAHFQAQQGFNVIIMSPLAAGVGLNITEANHVIHYSRWWNPAKEDQASDRVYRIGQKRPVHIYLPMSVHTAFQTFDVILHELLERKRQLSRGALFPTEQVEVTPAEVMSTLQEQSLEAATAPALTIEAVDMFEPAAFEAFIAALFQKQGYPVELTPLTGDKGADIIALPRQGETEGLLIQAKHPKNRKPGSSAVGEIVAAKPLYEQETGVVFRPLIITNHAFTREDRQLGKANNVLMYERQWLMRWLKQTPTTSIDVNQCELMRGVRKSPS